MQKKRSSKHGEVTTDSTTTNLSKCRGTPENWITYDHTEGRGSQALFSAWNFIIGGFHTFGPAINSRRVLMLLLQAGSIFILYCIARSISRNAAVAVITSLLFALSPYGIYFHRRVLLDNITTFWCEGKLVWVYEKGLWATGFSQCM